MDTLADLQWTAAGIIGLNAVLLAFNLKLLLSLRRQTTVLQDCQRMWDSEVSRMSKQGD